MLPKPAPEGRTDTLQCLKLPKCWQLISNTNIYCKMYIHQLKGSTETLQLAYIYPNCWLDICNTNNICIFWYLQYIYLYSIWGIHVSWIHILVLDTCYEMHIFNIYIYLYWIYAANILGDTCQLEVFCAPFGRRARECTFCNIYICIRYMRPTFGGYMSVGGFLCALWAQG